MDTGYSNQPYFKFRYIHPRKLTCPIIPKGKIHVPTISNHWFSVNMLVFAGATLPNHSSEYPMVKLPTVSSVTKTPIPGKRNPRWIDGIWCCLTFTGCFVGSKLTNLWVGVFRSNDQNFGSGPQQHLWILGKNCKANNLQETNLDNWCSERTTSETGAFLALRSNYPMKSLLSTDRWCPRKKILHFLVLDRLWKRDMNIFNGWFHVLYSPEN